MPFSANATYRQHTEHWVVLVLQLLLTVLYLPSDLVPATFYPTTFYILHT